VFYTLGQPVCNILLDTLFKFCNNDSRLDRSPPFLT